MKALVGLIVSKIPGAVAPGAQLLSSAAYLTFRVSRKKILPLTDPPGDERRPHGQDKAA